MQLSMPLMNLSTLVRYKRQWGSSRIFEIMQEPIEPMEDLQPIEYSITMANCHLKMLISNMISKLFLVMYLSVFLKER